MTVLPVCRAISNHGQLKREHWQIRKSESDDAATQNVTSLLQAFLSTLHLTPASSARERQPQWACKFLPLYTFFLFFATQKSPSQSSFLWSIICCFHCINTRKFSGRFIFSISCITFCVYFSDFYCLLLSV